MKDARCLLGFHRWVGRRRAPEDRAAEVRADVTGLTWTSGGLALGSMDDAEYVVWCTRCGKDRDHASWWLTALGE